MCNFDKLERGGGVHKRIIDLKNSFYLLFLFMHCIQFNLEYLKLNLKLYVTLEFVNKGKGENLWGEYQNLI